MRSSIYALAVATLLASASVVASYITMATGFSVTEGADGLTLNVTTKNQGDEPAYGIQFEVQVGNQTLTSATVPQLGVNETTSSDFSIHEVFNLPGHYPVLIKTHYQDANTYPFTALSVGFYDFQHPAVSKILIRAEDASIPLNGKGTMQYTVRNNDSAERDLVLTLHLPDELATLKDSDSLTIGPMESKSLQYTVENFSALENSGYAIALVAEYDDGNSHYSTAGTGTIRVIADVDSAVRPIWIWVVLGGLIPGVLVLLRLQKHRLGPGE